jgi:hypothetical protein
MENDNKSKNHITKEDANKHSKSEILHQNSKLEKDFKISSCSEIIAKNNYLKNLYFIGFNSKPVNKAILNSIHFSDAICSIKSFIGTDELNIKSCGSLILGLCKIYDKKIKVFYEEIENMLKINKDKKTLKAEKLQEEKILKKSKEPKEKEKNSKMNKISKEVVDETNIKNNFISNVESRYDEMFLSTNLNINTNSKSLNDFSFDNNLTKKNFNLYDITELNSEMKGSLNKLNLNSYLKNQTPLRMQDILNNEFESTQNKLEVLRARENSDFRYINNSNESNNLNSNSKFFNSGNQLINVLMDKSNLEDEIFNKNLNDYYLKIVSDEKLNFENFDNKYIGDMDNFYHEENNLNNKNNFNNDNNMFGIMPKKLFFNDLKNKLELEIEKSANFENTFENDLLQKAKKQIKSKIKKNPFEIDNRIYLDFKIHEKNKESQVDKTSKFKDKFMRKLNFKSAENVELLEKVSILFLFAFL